jgi:molecular chaperone DnaK
MMKAVGIDLGTTNSAVAYYDPERGGVRILANGEAENLTPSVVSVQHVTDGRETVLVGRQALNWALRQPKDTAMSVKRLMGRDFADPTVAKARERLTYEIAPGPDSDPRAHVVLRGSSYTPAHVSSLILEKLKRDASRTLGEDVTHAVITVPAYFQESQRSATREAGERAGLVVKKIIDEPTAAAVAFGLDARRGERHRVLVYDFGGGTFDISILHTVKDHEGRGQFHVLDFDGDAWLGGDDFDLAIVNKIVDYVRDRAGIDPTGDKAFLFLAKSQAVQAKLQLTNAQEAPIIISAYRFGDGTLIDVDMIITRDEFDTMIEPFVERSMELVHRALARQSLDRDDISDVLLVGGATLTPKVYETVESFFGTSKVRRDVNAMECVALGAGILAGTLHGLECPGCGHTNDEASTACEACGVSLASAAMAGDTRIYEVTSMAYGIAAVKGSQRDTFVPIIPRGTPYPLPQPMREKFLATDGRRIRVPIYEGNDPVVSRNREQGVIVYELPKEIDINTRVDVSFNLDTSRILNVTITVPGTGLAKTVNLRTDLPRTAPPAVTEDEEGEAIWHEELLHAVAITEMLLERYEKYMEPAQADKIKSDLDKAQHALDLLNPTEGAHMTGKLRFDIFNAGIATQLLMAERAADGATREATAQINQAVAAVQKAMEQGHRDEAAEKSRVLKAVVANVLKDRDVGEIPDTEDYEGMLRLFGE